VALLSEKVARLHVITFQVIPRRQTEDFCLLLGDAQKEARGCFGVALKMSHIFEVPSFELTATVDCVR
jgi:hypothetical protein